MPSQAEYFSKNRYHPVYHLGDRVRGLYNNIPFSGTVDIDTKVYENEEPYVIVYLDLPMKVDSQILTTVKVHHEDLLENKEKYDINRKTNRKKSTMGSNRR